MAEELDMLDVLNSLTVTNRTFYSNIRYLDAATRNNVVTLHERNTQFTLNLLRNYMNPPRDIPRRNMIFNIPINLDASGNFFDPIFVRPTAGQIANATEAPIALADTMCSICQEGVTSGTRIRHCGHCFHGECITQWFTLNTRCPVCRYDIREFTQSQRQTVNNDRGMHSDEE
jgi:hypothetical protein